MRSADLARPHMETLSDELDAECVASAVVGEDMVLVARAGSLRSQRLPSAVGQRIPFEPPLGTAFVAWANEAAKEAWLRRLGSDADAQTREVVERTLSEVRDAGSAIGRGARWHSEAAQVLTQDDPDRDRDKTAAQMHRLIQLLPPDYESPTVPTDDVRTINVPVFGPGGVVVLVLSVTVGGQRSLTADLPWTVTRLKSAASAVTKALEGSA
jgi:DNA-binding IclR family transcriptional regulator